MRLLPKEPSLYVSVVIPVYNEEKSLPLMFNRLLPVLDGLGKPYEVIFVNDGSRDRSQPVLEQLFKVRPEQIRVIELLHNTGQHQAVIAGFEYARGEVVVTLDCDLQNPPEEITRLLALIEQGHDVVGGIRAQRQDRSWRKAVSNLSNRLRERITHISMSDHGSMLRAYRRTITDQIVRDGGATPYIPAIAQYLATNPAEIPVGHEERAAGQSNYTLYKLLRLNFDLITSFSIAPLQLFTIMGMAFSLISGLFAAWVAALHLVSDAEQGNMMLFAILFLLVSVTMTGLGLIGEYIGRIYLEVRGRQRVVVKTRLEWEPEKELKILKIQ